MKTWPEFVIESDEAHRAQSHAGELTGWETVVFELGDASQGTEDAAPASG